MACKGGPCRAEIRKYGWDVKGMRQIEIKKPKKQQMSYQKFRKLAISNSLSSSLLREWERECEFEVECEWPEPSLEMDRLTLEVPRRCRTGREDLGLEG